MNRLARNPAQTLLGLALLTGFVMTLVITREMTFYQDTWAFLMDRRDPSADALFVPHNEHLVVFPVLIEEALIRIFGMSSAKPEYVLLALFLLATAFLLFVYVRRRVGDWMALFAAVLVLCVGPAWEVLLWPFEITFVGPLLFGIAMLLALERSDRLGDILACACLVLAIGFSGQGIGFIAAAVVAVALGPRETWLARSYIFLVPLVLYGIWWLGWGHDAESHISAETILASPRFVIDSIAFGLCSLVGLGQRIGTAPEPVWGRPLLVGLVIVLGLLQYRYRRRLDPRVWPIAAAAFASWFLTAFNDFDARDPSSSRYQYAAAIFILMILANLFSGWRPSRRAVIAGAAVTVLAVAPNLVFLRDGRDALNVQSYLTRADTGAIEIARRTVDPSFQLEGKVAGTPSLVNIYAGEYLQMVDEYGSPAYSPEELASAPELARRQADIVLANALRLSTATERGAYTGTGGGRCATLPGGGDGEPVPLRTGTARIEVAPGPHADFRLRRFAQDDFPISTEGAPGDSVTELKIPPDESDQPWLLQVEAAQSVRVCS
jgi:hypothetical protein